MTRSRSIAQQFKAGGLVNPTDDGQGIGRRAYDRQDGEYETDDEVEGDDCEVEDGEDAPPLPAGHPSVEAYPDIGYEDPAERAMLELLRKAHAFTLQRIASASALPPQQRLDAAGARNPKSRKRTQRNDDPAALARCNHFKLVEGPNLCVASKQRQLTFFDAVDKATKEKILQPNLLSYYIDSTPVLRAKLQSALLPPPVAAPGEVAREVFRKRTRLAQIPATSAVGADKGYVRHAILWPNMNRHVLPHFLGKRQQFYQEELEEDINIKVRRYISEVVFSRGQTQRILQGVISYGDFAILDDIVSYALGCCNLFQPLKKPMDWESYLVSLR
jgi:hypothetical protein